MNSLFLVLTIYEESSYNSLGSVSQGFFDCLPGSLTLILSISSIQIFNVGSGLQDCLKNIGDTKFFLLLLVGTPLKLDDTTSKSPFDRSFGHYAHVLVDIDLKSKLRDHILVERSGYAFSVGIEYENMPSFCSNCNIVGHTNSACKGRTHQAKQVYVPKHKALNNEQS